MIEFIPVVMVHDDLSRFKTEKFSLSRYSFRPYKSGDAELWSELQTTTDSFSQAEEALQYFDREFGGESAELTNRCFFLETKDQKAIGTAMAWLGDGRFSQEYGRLHWVVIHPDFRGKGLGKYLIKYTLYQIAQIYPKAYLTTQTTSYPAINIYLDFGFRPLIEGAESDRAWKLLKDVLHHPAL